ncbi:helix-turn-helix domain-containing protein [Parvibaculum lavamentivorans]|nr:helix-turn-helix domain-containing protein [Parvibaculum lavamentivorans]
MAEHRQEIGETLRDARQAAGLSLKDIADRLRIRPVYLQAIEAGQFELLPALPQTVGFTRAYAKFLDVDVERPLSRLGEEVHKHIESADYSEPELPWSQVSRARIAYVVTGAFIGAVVLAALLFDFGVPRDEINEAVAAAEGLFEQQPLPMREPVRSMPIASAEPRAPAIPAPVAISAAPAPSAPSSVGGSSPVTAEFAALLSRPAVEATPAQEAATVAPMEDANAFAISNVYLRASPGNAGEVIGVLDACEPLRLVGQDEGAQWHRIERADGTAGWVFRRYVGDKAAGCS